MKSCYLTLCISFKQSQRNQRQITSLQKQSALLVGFPLKLCQSMLRMASPASTGVLINCSLANRIIVCLSYVKAPRIGCSKFVSYGSQRARFVFSQSTHAISNVYRQFLFIYVHQFFDSLESIDIFSFQSFSNLFSWLIQLCQNEWKKHKTWSTSNISSGLLKKTLLVQRRKGE